MKLPAKATAILGAGILCAGLQGCLVVSYTSGSGWWVWPGSLVVTVALVLLWLISRR